jgi:hypothetical protein
VLSLPPAFALSQDQTLKLSYPLTPGCDTGLFEQCIALFCAYFYTSLTGHRHIDQEDPGQVIVSRKTHSVSVVYGRRRLRFSFLKPQCQTARKLSLPTLYEARKSLHVRPKDHVAAVRRLEESGVSKDRLVSCQPLLCIFFPVSAVAGAA